MSLPLHYLFPYFHMAFDGKNFCGVSDALGGMECLWPFPKVLVYASGMLGGVDLEEAVEQALGYWNDVCGIELQLTANARTAHIAITQGRIDGPSGTLAMSELPCGFTDQNYRTLRQQYDAQEFWTMAENPPNGKIDAVRVIAHEIGHACGMSHGAPGNLMAAMYSAQIRRPQRGDIIEMLARYPRLHPRPTPVPLPTPVPVIPGGSSMGGLLKTLVELAKFLGPLLRNIKPEDIQAILEFIKIIRGLSPQQMEALKVAAEEITAE